MKIVSGGQTGVDRAALDVALEMGIPCGGWCPHGRKSDEGTIPAKYPLQETPLPEYEQRTEWNVKGSNGTLVLAIGKPSGGTALTIGYARRYSKPCLVADLNNEVNFDAILEWIEKNRIRTLNVAGPSESQHPGIHDLAVRFLKDLLADEQ
jgi:hypothetical protein